MWQKITIIVTNKNEQNRQLVKKHFEEKKHYKILWQKYQTKTGDKKIARIAEKSQKLLLLKK